MLELNAIGNLGNDPETKTMQNGTTLVRFRLAAKRRTGKGVETEWINVTAFGKLGELAQQYLHKGSQIYVSGTPAAHGFQNRTSGEVSASIDLAANVIEFLDRKTDREQEPEIPTHHTPPIEQPSQGFTPADEQDLPF